MSFPKALGASLALLGMLYGFQLPFREFPGVEYRLGDIPLPPDFQEKTEWAFARLMYPQSPFGRGGRGFGFRGFGGGGQWTQGNTMWTQDYPRADSPNAPPARRPSLRAGPPPLDPTARPLRRTAGESGRRWRRGLALALCRAARPLAVDRLPGESAARIPAARRLLHGGRFLGTRRVGDFHGQHEEGFPRPPGGGTGKQRGDFSHRLRSRRSLPGGQPRFRNEGRQL